MMLRKLFLFIFFLSLLFSCKSNIAQGNKKVKSVEQILLELNPQDTIKLLDLSNRDISELPDLSRFKVKKLNISHNNLDTLIMKHLPTYLVELDASHNKIKKGISFIFAVKKFGYKVENNISKYIEQINISNNEIEGISFLLYETGIKRIIVSDNKLNRVYLYLNGEKLNYLDVSNNKKFSNMVTFDPTKIDTIKSNNIAIDAPLKLIKIGIIREISKKN